MTLTPRTQLRPAHGSLLRCGLLALRTSVINSVRTFPGRPASEPKNQDLTVTPIKPGSSTSNRHGQGRFWVLLIWPDQDNNWIEGTGPEAHLSPVDRVLSDEPSMVHLATCQVFIQKGSNRKNNTNTAPHRSSKNRQPAQIAIAAPGRFGRAQQLPREEHSLLGAR